MKQSFRRWCQGLVALALCAFALPSLAAEAVKLSNVANSITFRDGSGHRGNYGFNGGSYSTQMFDGNFTSGIYQNGVGCQLVVPTTHIVTDPNGQPYVTEVKVGHLGNSKYSLYYTTEEEPADILTYSQDPRTWTPIEGATGVQEAGTKTFNVNQVATAIMYVFDTAPSWTQAACEFEVWGYEYVPAVAVKISNVGRSITFRDGAGHRGNYGFNGGSYSTQMFDGNFTSGIYQNGVGCQLVVPTTGLDDQGNDTGVAWYVTEVKVGHLGNSKYSLYYTTEAEPADILTYSKDPRTWTAIDGATGVQEAGTKTYNVNKNATAVMYVFDTAPSWTQAACEFEVWAMDPSSISCLHEHLDQAVWTVFQAATCTENAFEECNCPDCGERFEREVPLSKLGHDFVATLTTPGSATAYGSGYVECSRCNEFHLEFDGDTVDLTTLGGPPISGVVQYTDLTVSSTGAEDGGVKPVYVMDGYWDNGWGHAWYSGDLGTNEWVQYAFGTTIDLTKIEYSVINESQTVYFSSYDPATGEETLLRTIPIKKDTTEGAPGYQRKTEMFFGEGDVEHVFVDAVRMRIGDYVDPDTGETTAYRGYNYGAHDRHVIVCEFHPWGTIEGAGMTAAPVAMIGDASYASLADAVEAAKDGDTIVLQKDDDVSFADGGVVITNSIVIDGGGHTVKGVSATGAGNVASMADVTDENVTGFYVKSGNVTFKNLVLTEFGDTDWLNKFGRVPILTSTDYAGTLTLQNVSIDKFNRQAVCINGGTFSITGGTIAANAEGKGSGDYFQQPIEIRGGSGTISGVTITGGGSNVGYDGGAIVVFPGASGTVTVNNANIAFDGIGIWADACTVAVTGAGTSVTATNDVLFAEEGGSLTVAAGTFTGSLGTDADPASSIAVSGGTFSQPVLPAYCAPGYVPVANEDGGTTTYGVKRAWVVTFVNDKGDAPAAQVVDVVAGTDVFATEPDPAPTATGYTFDGWFEDGAATAFDFATAITADLVLTAGWTVNQYTVAFEWHDGAVTNDYDYGTAAADVAVPRNPPTYVENDTIYTFTGWDADVADVTADVTYTAVYSSAAAAARVNGGSYATLAEAIAAAQDGDTVVLLDDVTLDARVEPNLGAGTTLVIDLGGNTIARTGTSGNGSAFDVKSGSVTITNGVIDCTQDDTDIAKDGVYAITARSGSAVTLAGLTVTVDSECGACVYPFSGATATIRSGTYANTTKTPYRYKTDWTGMTVNQPNNTAQILTIYGGSFAGVDPSLGDDSGNPTTFLAPGYATVLENGFYVVQEAPAVEVKPDAPVEIEAESQADAEAKAAAIPVVIDDAAAAAAGQAEVLKKVVAYDGTTGKYVVSVEIDEEKVEPEETVAEVAGSLATVSDATPGTSTEVVIPAESVTPGLYYSVSMVTDLSGADWNAGEGDRELATDEGVTLSVPKPANGDKAFYKVLVNMTDND